MQDILIGAISGLRIDAIAPFVNSLDRSGFKGRKILIDYDNNGPIQAWLRGRGYQIAIVPSTDPQGAPPGDLAKKMRYVHSWQILSSVADDQTRFVVLTDVRDVVFQHDPSQWLEKNMGEKPLILAQEAGRFAQSPWNRRKQIENYGHAILEQLNPRPVVCSGVIAGRLRAIRDLALSVYLATSPDRALLSDQAALNALMLTDRMERDTALLTLEDDWVCHLALMAEMREAKVADSASLTSAPYFDGDCVRTPGGKAYAIVHQYDRIPEWRTHFERKFGLAP